MIAIVLEMSDIPSLAFAVGVYLPLSSSSPIFLGGMIRWLVDKYIRVKFHDKNLTEEEFVAETDKSPGVLMASGYIAGGGSNIRLNELKSDLSGVKQDGVNVEIVNGREHKLNGLLRADTD